MQGADESCAAPRQFKRAFKRNDKPICLAVAKFIAHLTNQLVVHELLALQILILLVANPSGAPSSRRQEASWGQCRR